MSTLDTQSDSAPSPKPPSLVVNAISSYAAMGTRLVVMLFLTPYLIRTLGKESYGIWVLVVSVVGYAGILDLGVSRALQRYVARHAGQGDSDAVNRTLGTAMLFYGVVGALAGCVLGVSGGMFAEWLNVPIDQRGVFRGVMWAAGLNCMLGMIAGVVKQALTAREAFVRANLVVIVSQLALAIGTVLAVELNEGLQGVAIALVVSTCVALAMFYVLTRTRFPQTDMSPFQFQWSVLRPMLGFGFFAVIWVVADQLRFRVSPLIIGHYVSVEAITVFVVGAMIVNQIGQLFVAGCDVLGPRFASLDGQGHAGEFSALFLRASGIAAFVAAVAFGLAILLGELILQLWIGGDMTESYHVMLMLACGYGVVRAQSAGVPALYAKDKHRAYAVVMLVEGAVNVALSCLLVRWWGVTGAAIGVAAPMLVVGMIAMPMYMCRVAGVAAGPYFYTIVGRQVLVMGVACAAVWLVRTKLGGSLPAVLMATGLWCCFVIGLFWREFTDVTTMLWVKVSPVRPVQRTAAERQ